MKKTMILWILLIISLLVFAGCNDNSDNNMNNDMTQNNMIDNNNPMASNDVMEAMDEDEAMEEAPMMTNEGDLALDFELMDLEGNTVSLSGLSGEKVYVKFWASWCSICVAGLDELDELSSQENDFEILTIVSPDYNGESSLSQFKTWYEKQDMEHMTVLIDQDGDVARAYGVRAYPSSALIGSDGVMVHFVPGHLSGDVLINEFDKIY